MNLKKLSKEKRNNLILVVLLTAGAIGGLGYGLIRYQYQNLANLSEKQEAATKMLEKVKDTLKRGPDMEVEASQLRTALTEAEADIASGDLYA